MCRQIIRKAWLCTIVGNVFGVSHDLCIFKNHFYHPSLLYSFRILLNLFTSSIGMHTLIEVKQTIINQRVTSLMSIWPILNMDILLTLDFLSHLESSTSPSLRYWSTKMILASKPILYIPKQVEYRVGKYEEKFAWRSRYDPVTPFAFLRNINMS